MKIRTPQKLFFKLEKLLLITSRPKDANKPQIKNMFNPNVGPDIRFTNVEHNKIGLPFQFGRPKPKSTRAAPQEKPRLRPIVIDGQNVAVEHAKQTQNPFGFSSRH